MLTDKNSLATSHCIWYFIKSGYYAPNSFLLRVSINDKDVKVNIFDMAGHPVFYEVDYCYFCRH